MSVIVVTREQTLTALAEVPARLAAITAVLTPEQLQTPLAEGEWSIRDVVAHLRACGYMWGNAISTMLNQDNPTIRAMNPTTWIEKTDYFQQPFAASFRVYTTQRAELLAILTPLPSEAWDRTATVTGAGRPLERTVLFYAKWLANHERPHVKQIEKAAKGM